MASSVGDSGIALGNAIGSCICNIGLIIGTVAILAPVEVEKRDFVNRAAWMVSAGVLIVLGSRLLVNSGGGRWRLRSACRPSSSAPTFSTSS